MARDQHLHITHVVKLARIGTKQIHGKKKKTKTKHTHIQQFTLKTEKHENSMEILTLKFIESKCFTFFFSVFGFLL